jgi:hypothetical protein
LQEMKSHIPLPSIEGAKRFLTNYLCLIREVKVIPTETLLKGKHPVVDIGTLPVSCQKPQGPLKPWMKPPTGWVKLSVLTDHTAHRIILLASG